jgi:hypothetical protein
MLLEEEGPAEGQRLTPFLRMLRFELQDKMSWMMM